MGVRLVPTSVTLNDLERRNSPYNAISLEADYVTAVVEDRPIMSAKYRRPVIFCQTCPTQQLHGLFATAKLVYCCNVIFYRTI